MNVISSLMSARHGCDSNDLEFEEEISITALSTFSIQECVEERDSLGRHCLHLAAQAGQLASIDYLISNFGIDVNMRAATNGMVPLHFAAKVHFSPYRFLLVSISN